MHSTIGQQTDMSIVVLAIADPVLTQIPTAAQFDKI